MLILSRKVNQAIHMGKDIIVHVLEIRGGQVRVGIEAPLDINIVRDELLQADDDYAVRVVSDAPRAN